MNQTVSALQLAQSKQTTASVVLGRPRRVKRSEAMRLRLRDTEWEGLDRLASRTGINKSRLARKALRELITGGVDLLEREQQAVLTLSKGLRALQFDLHELARHCELSGADADAVLAQLSCLEAWCAESDLRWRGLIAAARARTVPEHGRT